MLYFRRFRVKEPRHSENIFAKKRYTLLIPLSYEKRVYYGGNISSQEQGSAGGGGGGVPLLFTAGCEQRPRVTLYLT